MSGSPGDPASGGNRELCPASASAGKAELSRGSLLINQLHPRPGPTAWPSLLCSLKPSASRDHPITTALQQFWVTWVGSIPHPFLPPSHPLLGRATFSSPGDLGGSIMVPAQGHTAGVPGGGEEAAGEAVCSGWRHQTHPQADQM